MFSKRNLLISAAAGAATALVPVGPACAADFSPGWMQLGQAIGDVATGLDRVVDVISHAATAAGAGIGALSARSARHRLTSLSGTMSDLYGTQGALLSSIDAYGDLWRRWSGGGTASLTSAQAVQLQTYWESVLRGVRAVLTEVQAAMLELRADRSDLAVSKAYLSLSEALNLKVGILARISRLPAPMNSVEIQALVDSEENFMHLRSSLNSAIDALNSFVLRL